MEFSSRDSFVKNQIEAELMARAAREQAALEEARRVAAERKARGDHDPRHHRHSIHPNPHHHHHHHPPHHHSNTHDHPDHHLHHTKKETSEHVFILHHDFDKSERKHSLGNGNSTDALADLMAAKNTHMRDGMRGSISSDDSDNRSTKKPPKRVSIAPGTKLPSDTTVMNSKVALVRRRKKIPRLSPMPKTPPRRHVKEPWVPLDDHNEDALSRIHKIKPPKAKPLRILATRESHWVRATSVPAIDNKYPVLMGIPQSCQNDYFRNFCATIRVSHEDPRLLKLLPHRFNKKKKRLYGATPMVFLANPKRMGYLPPIQIQTLPRLSKISGVPLQEDNGNDFLDESSSDEEDSRSRLAAPDVAPKAGLDDEFELSMTIDDAVNPFVLDVQQSAPTVPVTTMEHDESADLANELTSEMAEELPSLPNSYSILPSINNTNEDQTHLESNQANDTATVADTTKPAPTVAHEEDELLDSMKETNVPESSKIELKPVTAEVSSPKAGIDVPKSMTKSATFNTFASISEVTSTSSFQPISQSSTSLQPIASLAKLPPSTTPLVKPRGGRNRNQEASGTDEKISSADLSSSSSSTILNKSQPGKNMNTSQRWNRRPSLLKNMDDEGDLLNKSSRKLQDVLEGDKTMKRKGFLTSMLKNMNVLDTDTKQRLNVLSAPIFGGNETIQVNSLDNALRSLNVVRKITDNEIEYIKKVFELVSDDELSPDEFCVIAALAERMTLMDQNIRLSFYDTDFKKLERKIREYRKLFTVYGQEDGGHMTYDDLNILLLSSGSSKDQIDDIKQLLSIKEKSATASVEFIDFLSYIPFFTHLHQNIVNNPFGDSLLNQK